MAKQKSSYSVTTYGIYEHWDSNAKQLPKIIEFTNTVTAIEDIEFGFTFNAKRAKGQKLTFNIFHPDIPDDNGNVMAPFTGEVYVDNNNWDFYLGDCIWLPLHNKVGCWRMTIEHNGKVLAEKQFDIILEEHNEFKRKHGY